MSIEWMTHVWNNSKQKGSRLLMILAIADHANDEGSAYPGLESLARKTRQTKRNAIRIIDKIVQDGELEIDTKASRLGTNLYQIKVSTRKPKIQGGDILGKGGDILGKGGDILGKRGGDNPVPEMSPESSLTINDKSSVESSADKPRSSEQSNPLTREIQAAYAEACGYPIIWSNGNGKAAKWLADNGYTPDEIRACYADMKRDPWWADKPIQLQSIVKKIGDWKHRHGQPAEPERRPPAKVYR